MRPGSCKPRSADSTQLQTRVSDLCPGPCRKVRRSRRGRRRRKPFRRHQCDRHQGETPRVYPARKRKCYGLCPAPPREHRRSGDPNQRGPHPRVRPHPERRKTSCLHGVYRAGRRRHQEKRRIQSPGHFGFKAYLMAFLEAYVKEFKGVRAGISMDGRSSKRVLCSAS